MRQMPVLLCLLATSFAVGLQGDETFYETKGGTTYRVTRRLEKTPVAETRTETKTQKVYKTEYETEMRETTRAAWTPITQFVYEPRWHGWWNPFAEPYLTYEPRPVTHWELKTQTVREPVTRRRDVPQDRIVHVPVRSLGFVERPVEERIAVTTGPAKEVPSTEMRFAERAVPATQIRTAEMPRVGQPATTLSLPIRR